MDNDIMLLRQMAREVQALKTITTHLQQVPTSNLFAGIESLQRQISETLKLAHNGE